MVRDEAANRVLGVTAKPRGSAAEETVFASLTVSADGYASNFRKRCTSKKPQVRSYFVGLELRDAVLPAPNHGHVVMGSNPPVLLYQIGSRDTRALVAVPQLPPSGTLRDYLRRVVLPDMPPAVQPSFDAAIDADRLPSMPNSFLAAAASSTPGMILLGDAMNMRHPLTGGGMTVAFNDVVLVSRLLSPEQVPDLADCALVGRRMRAFHWERKALSGVVNILAQALYSLFAASDPRMRVLQRGCFKYFQRGGQCVDGPVGLLAGVTRRPVVLFYHFFAVALYSIYVMFASLTPVLEWPRGVLESLAVFWTACVVIFPYIFAEFLT